MKFILGFVAIAALAFTCQAETDTLELEERQLSNMRQTITDAINALKKAGKWTAGKLPSLSQLKEAAKSVGSATWRAIEACERSSICKTAAEALISVVAASLG